MKVFELRENIADAIGRRDFDAARRCAESLMRFSRTEALGALVSISIEAGDLARAREELSSLEKEAPTDIYTRFLAARTEFMDGERVGVIERLKPMLGEKLRGALREKVMNLLGQCYRFIGESEKAASCYLAASRAAKSKELAALEYGNYLFNLHYLPPSPAAGQRETAARYGAFFADVPRFRHRWRRIGPKIRVGYISPDFREHVVLRFSLAMVTGYDKERFEVYAYMTGEEDERSPEVKKRVDCFRNISGLSNDEAARVIYEDGVDILVDLAGHTRKTTLPILARKPAPVIVSGVGYFASTGLPAVDYFLGDPYIDDETTEKAFTEELVILPRTHLCYVPRPDAPAPSDPPCARNGYITFASFSNFTKVNAEVLSAWKRLMDAVPGSRLLMKAEVFGRDDSLDLALRKLRRTGIDLSRVEARPVTKDYLEEYKDADIALDTFPYPGGGTTFDALFMGVPVVTLAGDDHGGRFGVSIMANLGLSELVSYSVDEYVEKAAGLAGDMELLTCLRKSLRSMMSASPLMNIEGYQKDIAAAYEMIWDKYIKSQEPPDYAGVLRASGEMESLFATGDTTQALALADAVLASGTNDASLLRRLAAVYIDAGDVTHSRETAERLLSSRPDGYALYFSAEVENLAGNDDLAEKLSRDALSDEKLDDWAKGAAHHLLAEIYKKRGERDKTADEYLASSEYKDVSGGKLADYGNYLLSLHFRKNDRRLLYDAAKRFDSFFTDVKKYKHDVSRHRRDKIRIGCISPDFGPHIVAAFSRAFFEDFDRRRFEVYGYSLSEENAISRLLAKSASCWKNISGLTADEAAKEIYDDDVDILVDFSGHTGRNALPILARKPAPIEVSGIGYFDTTGLRAVDYFIVDSHTAPHGEDEFFTEKLMRLPESHLCYKPLPGAPSYVSPAPFRGAGFVTFGSLGAWDKVTDDALHAWGRILSKIKDSRLFLKGAVFDDEPRREKIFSRLKRLGIDTTRVDTEGWTGDYFSAYDRIDIALDTAPYPGGGTTCDALYMGVPVVTLAGESHHERFGKSLLENSGLSDLVAGDWDEYVEKAVSLAKDEERLSDLHQSIRRKMRETSLMDAGRYMTMMEDAFEVAFSNWCRPAPDELSHCRDEFCAAIKRDDWEKLISTGKRLAYGGDDTGDVLYFITMAYHALKDHIRVIFWAKRAIDAGAQRRGNTACAISSSTGRAIDAGAERLGELFYMLAYDLQQSGRWDETIRIADEYLMDEAGHTPLSAAFSSLRASSALTIGRPDAQDFYLDAFRRSCDFKARTDMYSSWLLSLNSVQIDEKELFQKHLGYNELFGEVKPYEHTRRRRHEKLRIGYISPDFRRHVMYGFYLPLLSRYDHDRFEVYAYATGEKRDQYTDGLKGLVTMWRDEKGKPFEDIARDIYEDEVDILFDLAGHSAGSGLPALSWRPAPVQISGLGYMTTTGLRSVDYFLSDPVVDPPGMHEDLFTEKLLRVTSQFCYSPPKEDLPPSFGTPAKKRGWVLFGVFNQYKKISDGMLDAWRRVLDAVPLSKILIKAQVFYSPHMMDEAFCRMKSAGLDMERVIMEPATFDYRMRYLDVDIALDTYPYTGGGTTADALYMGVPVVTLYSGRRSTRFGLGILSAVGLPELAASTLDGYVERAVGLARDTELLDALHLTMRERMRSSPLMDAARYVKEVEACYEAIWRDWILR